MPEPGKVGVVTVTYNSGKVIRAFMASMLRQAHDNFILYVIDNASADETLCCLADYQDSRIVLITNQVNVGVAEGNNQGILQALQADCEYVLLLNNDTEFDRDLISSLCADIRQHHCDMIVPKMMYYDQPDTIWCAGGGFSRARGSGFSYGINCRDTGQFDVPRQVDYAPTCCMLVKADVFRRVGLMDARYFVYFDDTDFCLRACRLGQKLYYTPSARLLHKVGSLTGGHMSPLQVHYATRNHVYYLAKNFGWWHCLYYLPLYQLKLAAKLLLGRLSLGSFRISQMGFWQGLRMAASRGKQNLATAREPPTGGGSAAGGLAEAQAAKMAARRG